MTEDVVVERIRQARANPGSNRIPLFVARQGLSMGMALAMICSWQVSKSVAWAFVHGILSWLYVIYYALVHSWGV